jgi:hypothetical protein
MKRIGMREPRKHVGVGFAERKRVKLSKSQAGGGPSLL